MDVPNKFTNFRERAQSLLALASHAKSEEERNVILAIVESYEQLIKQMPSTHSGDTPKANP